MGSREKKGRKNKTLKREDKVIFLPERKNALPQTREKECKWILCPEGKGKIVLMCEWEVVSEKGRILKRSLKQIDCQNPQLMEFGGADCHWGCEGIIEKREK